MNWEHRDIKQFHNKLIIFCMERMILAQAINETPELSEETKDNMHREVTKQDLTFNIIRACSFLP